ncbi:MAG: ECF transporter S component [Clostridiaceae bacterium]
MENKNTKNIVRSALMLAVVIVFQFIGRNVPQINQFFVGPIVNTVLLITAFICGTKWGLLTGLLTPIMALLVGQLAAPMAPFIPFIAIGNMIYVLIFGLLTQDKIKRIIGIVIGSLAKFIFLYFSAVKLTGLFNLNIPPKVLSNLAVAMGIPQLLTALAGGIFALALVEILTRRKVII